MINAMKLDGKNKPHGSAAPALPLRQHQHHWLPDKY